MLLWLFYKHKRVLSNWVTVSSNTYLIIRDTNTAPSEDCKNPDAITTVECVNEQF